ncbi:MAG: ribosome small subunit-dependent GTPase A [Gemmatimonadota bacterium]|nr:ribosome small subunit-dependent GTPase A [Gemmatimonadota bacterium]MDE2872622.1 ribosome small subunit-dependent GTPase A [Gemmatimonadota bacterium]
MTTGQVIETVGGTYTVRTASGTLDASLRGRLKRSGRVRDRVVVGDRVELAQVPGGGRVIESVRPRRTYLARRAAGGRVAKVVAANLDRLVVVASVADPPATPGVVDRMLVMGESGGMDTCLVLNKVDLGRGGAAARQLSSMYRSAGYPVMATSVVTGEGMDAFRDMIRAGSSVLVGPSGVGKSSLLNAVDPALELRTRRVGRRSRSGKHTTVSSRLIVLKGGGVVADTPGFTDVGLGDVAAAELDRCFADFRRFLGRCHFNDCRHVHEPGCAVLAAVAGGRIQQARHDSYRAILAEL